MRPGELSVRMGVHGKALACIQQFREDHGIVAELGEMLGTEPMFGVG
jgi:hypothetical protein